jgi:hypothetical protein
MPHSLHRNFSRLTALSIAFWTVACTRQEPQDNAAETEPAETVPAANESAPMVESALDREQLLVTLLGAAGDAIVGADDAETQKALKGRRFDLRMRFGCPDTPPIAGRSWTYDEKSGAMKVTVKPDVDEEIEHPATTDGPEAKPAKAHRGGFQIPGPTLLPVGCPTADFAAVPGFTNLRFALVQTTDADSPRAQQLLNSYEIVKKIAPDAAPTKGLDLILRGRLESDAQGRVVTCAPNGGVAECLANVTIDKVSIENPETSVLVAEWGAN